MTDNPWTRQQTSARFEDPAACAKRTTSFERKIKRRNFVEFAAAALVTPGFAIMTVGAAIKGEWLFAASGAICLAAILWVLIKLHRDGRNLDRQPEHDCRTHLRSQFVRQRNLLRSVPIWYLAPLGTGILSVYAVVAYKVTEAINFTTALEGIWLPAVGTVALFGLIGWTNVAAARRLDREIGQLDALG